MSTRATETAFRRSQNRHSASGSPCHHFVYHHLTCDQYDELVARSGGRCEMCQTPIPMTGGRRLVVDHFQSSLPRMRIIRGMLCDACNATMSCLDGTKRWGPRRAFLEPRARAYQALVLQHLPRAKVELMERVQEECRRRKAVGPGASPAGSEENTG
jgi:hypothetical protein